MVTETICYQSVLYRCHVIRNIMVKNVIPDNYNIMEYILSRKTLLNSHI